MSLESIVDGQCTYWVTRLDPDDAHAWRVVLSKDFDAWTITPVQ
jgi:hypothetical protein